MAHTSGHGHGHGHATPDLGEISKLGYEPRDIALNTLSVWLGVLFVFIALASVFGYIVYKAFVPKYAEMEFTSPLGTVRTLPPNPQVQVRPRRDMIDYWAHEDKIIKTSTPGEKGTVNLPIGEAMDTLADRGISGVTGAYAPPSTDAYPGSGQYTRAESGNDGTESLNGNFEDIAAKNPFIGHPVPMPQPTAPAPGSTDASGDSAAPAPAAE